MRYLILFLFISLSFQGFAQSTLRPMDQTIQMRATQEYNERLYKASNKKMLSKNPYEEIDGSAYFYEDPTIARLLLVNDEIAEVNLLIDRYADELVSVAEDETQRLLDPLFFKSIELEWKGETRMLKKLNPDFPQRFYEVIIDGPSIILLRDIEVKHMETSLITEGRRENVSKFRRNDNFILVQDAKVEKISFKKKKFFKLFSDAQSNQLEKLAKDNGIKLKSDEDFIRLLSIYNQETP